MSNYCTIHDGFVYHGHDGGVPGGLTSMGYMFNEGIGYFYSINSGNFEAFEKVGAIIRAYLTRHLQKPSIPTVVSLPEKTNAYTGWYEPNSPRMELLSFFERLIGLAYIHFEDNKLLINSFSDKNVTFLPVTDTEFLFIPKNESQYPLPTLKLLKAKAEGQFIQINLGMKNTPSLNVTMKRIPTWLAIFEIIMTGFVLLTFISTLIYAPFWIL